MQIITGFDGIKHTTKRIAMKDYSWWSADDNSTKRKVNYSEKTLLKRSLECEDDSGIINHPELGHVYAMKGAR